MGMDDGHPLGMELGFPACIWFEIWLRMCTVVGDVWCGVEIV